MIRSTRSTRRRERLTHPPGADRTGAFRPVTAAAALAAALALGAGFVVTGSASAGAAGASPEDPIVLASPGAAPPGAATEGAHRDEATCETTQVWVHTTTTPARIEYYQGSSATGAALVAGSPGADWEPFGDPGHTEWTGAGDPQWGETRPGEDTELVRWEQVGVRVVLGDDGTSDSYQRHVWNPQGPSIDGPPAWPEPGVGTWRADRRQGAPPNEEVGVVHRGNGNGSYFYWEVIQGTAPTSTTEYLWQGRVREVVSRYRRVHPESSETTHYFWSDGTTECPEQPVEPGEDPGPTADPDPTADPSTSPAPDEDPDRDEEPDTGTGATAMPVADAQPPTSAVGSAGPSSDPSAATAHRAPETVPASDREAASTPEVPTRIAAGS